jgi:hypothetical protein
MSALHVVPITLAEANAYIERFHRHNGALPSAKLTSAVVDEEMVVHGVAVAGLPKARELMARTTLEINRVCADGERNACSLLYASMLRAGRALGYTRFVTYSLKSENGASLRAAGWTPVAEWAGGKWSEMRGTGSDGHNTGPKVRWEIHVAGVVSTSPLVWPAQDVDLQQQLTLDV